MRCLWRESAAAGALPYLRMGFLYGPGRGLFRCRHCHQTVAGQAFDKTNHLHL